MLEYIQQELDKKNKNIYFKKYRWILHVIYWAFVFYRGQTSLPEFDWSLNYFLFAFLITNIGVALFYYFYCLYLVPNYFKRNQFVKFWLYLIVSLFVISIVDFLWNAYGSQFYPKGFNDMYNFNFKDYFQLITQGYLINFLLFSALLYLIEVSEGIHTWKQIKNTQTDLSQTEKLLSNTQLSPNFIMESLDNIIKLIENNNDNAGDSTLLFSEILRYKLYKSDAKKVPIQEEITQLENIFSLHKIKHQTYLLLETQLDASITQISPLLIINIIEPFLETFEINSIWSMESIVFLEQSELNISIDIQTSQDDFNTKISQIESLLKDNSSQPITFTTEIDKQHFSIQICQKVTN